MERNKDGLIPGELVDFATINRINKERAEKEAQAEQKPASKPGPKPKEVAARNDE